MMPLKLTKTMGLALILMSNLLLRDTVRNLSQQERLKELQRGEAENNLSRGLRHVQNVERKSITKQIPVR